MTPKNQRNLIIHPKVLTITGSGNDVVMMTRHSVTTTNSCSAKETPQGMSLLKEVNNELIAVAASFF